MFALFAVAQASTSTTAEEVPRVVGDHPGNLLVIGAGVVLLVLILAAGLVAGRRGRQVERREG